MNIFTFEKSTSLFHGFNVIQNHLTEIFVTFTKSISVFTVHFNFFRDGFVDGATQHIADLGFVRFFFPLFTHFVHAFKIQSTPTKRACRLVTLFVPGSDTPPAKFVTTHQFAVGCHSVTHLTLGGIHNSYYFPSFNYMPRTRSQQRQLNDQLIAAVNTNNTNRVRALLNQGANPRIGGDEHGSWTPLHMATTPQMARMLINAGAKLNARNVDGWTPLHAARTPNLIRFLINAGANVNVKNNSGWTPLHMASVGEQSLNRARVLINAGANVNAKNNTGHTPLHVARNPQTVRFLINSGANVHARTNYGSTPLHEYSDLNRIRMLINAGANVNAKNSNNRKPNNTVHSQAAKNMIRRARAAKRLQSTTLFGNTRRTAGLPQLPPEVISRIVNSANIKVRR